MSVNTFFKGFTYLFSEREGDGEREGEKETLVSCLSHVPSRTPGSQPRHVPWLGNELATFRCRPILNLPSHTSQGSKYLLSSQKAVPLKVKHFDINSYTMFF